MRRTFAAGAILALSLTLSACSGDAPDEATAAPATETSTEAEASAPVDRTADAQAVAGDVVTKATETEPGRIEVETTIADPRSDAGSAEAQSAIAVCEAVKGLGAEHVSVLESDGSTFVVAGHPSYGEACAEV
ncbi:MULTISPECIES: hypothetical protein [Cellulosimicrobium]|uniref:hypothetical protein n=1 Tax=Cellulosimicrobium TaxID=157920 RepID=UPI00145926F5|nr:MULTISPECIES: hypothetical protein [Cellulosimicrobium]NMF27899.1 hypothetical protein [Cellulosimicrobium aquatile]QUB98628.1 hypothetical protein J5A69_12725 [Cellulosimicrobium cellulans]